MTKVALYVRVSTQEQKKKGLSVDSQIEGLKKYAADHGYFVTGIYNDAGFSARKSYKKRPELLRLLDDCRSGMVDLILFTCLDRWFRNIADYYEVQSILDSCKVPWRAIWEDFETITANGVFKVNITLSVSQQEADKDSERIKTAMAYKKDRGDYIGAAPLGFYAEKGKLFKDDEVKDGVEAFFSTYLSSFIVSQSIKAAGEHGVVISRRRARYMLGNSIYAGFSGNVRCEAYITSDQYQVIRNSLDGRRLREPSRKYGNRVYLFSGLCRCGECGRSMTVKVRIPTVRNPNKREYYSYRCTLNNETGECPTRNISELNLEKFLLSELDGIIEKRAVLSYDSVDFNFNINKKIEKLRQKLVRIGERYEDCDISRAEYREKRDRINFEILSLEKELVPERESIVLPDDWKDIYSSLDREHKRAFWHSIIKEIHIFSDKHVEVF